MKLGLTTALATHHQIKDLLAGLAYPIYRLDAAGGRSGGDLYRYQSR